MSVKSWDFREILDCYPDRPGFTCVGITKKGKRCGQWMFSGSDLPCASRMLDEMSCYEKLSSSYKDLERLAGLTLCPRWHRKPGYSQVRSVSLEWRTKIATREVEFERRREGVAMIKSERALASVRENVSNIKVKLEEEEINDKIPAPNPQTIKEQKAADLSVAYQSAKLKMQASSLKYISKPAQGTITPPKSSHNTPSQFLGPTIVAKKESNNTLSPPSTLASPVTSKQGIAQEINSPTPSPTTAPQAASPERQSFMIMKTSSTKVTTKAESNDLPPKTIFKERTKLEAFNFEFPPTPDTIPPSKQSNESTGMEEPLNITYEFGAGKQVPPPVFDVGITAKLPKPVLETDDSRSSFSSDKRVKSRHDVSAFRFNPDYKLQSESFELATPTKLSYAMRLPEKPSTIWDDFNAHADKKSPAASEADPFSSNERLENAPQAPTTPVKTTPNYSVFAPVTLEGTPEPSQHPAHVDEESYGFAIVSPSTCYSYKTYLPTQRLHGLVTPPETPKPRRDWYQDPFFAFNSSPSPVAAILQKPLPSLPTPQPREGETGMCEACGLGEDGCHCDEGSEMENGRVSCFYSPRLRRLRKRVVRKVNAVKTGVFEAIHRNSGLPKAN